MWFITTHEDEGLPPPGHQARAAWPEDPPGPPPAGEGSDPPGIAARFAALAAAQPDSLAASDGAERLGFGAMAEEVARLAALIAASVPPGGAVALLLRSTPRAVAALLACGAAGRTCLILNHHNPEERTRAILEDAGAAAVLAEPATRFDDPGRRWLDLSDPAPSGGPAPRAQGLDAPAVVLYTSGSTGLPKGIALSERILLRRWARNARHLGLVPGDRLMTLNLLATSGGLTHGMAALLSGAAILLTDPSASGPVPIQALAAAEGTSVLVGLPRMMLPLLRGSGAASAFARLRAIRLFGTTTSRAEHEALRGLLPPGCRTTMNYGQTEAQIADWLVPETLAAEMTTLPAGRLVRGQDYALLDPEGRPVPAGEAGELLVRSSMVALGDWQANRVLDSRIAPDPDAPGTRILRTGDLARLDAEAVLHILGRVDRQVKIAGQRVEPGEVEALLAAAPGVAEAVVIPRAAPGGPVLHAVIVPEAGVAPAALEAVLRDRAAAGLPRPLRPVAYRFLPDLPRLPGGKPDLLALGAGA